jgi:hypothetical protein
LVGGEKDMSDNLREREALLPCPFCGETASRIVGGVVGCTSCDIWMTQKEWNRRALLAETPGEVRTSGEWAAKHTEFSILDPDGWDRSPEKYEESWNERITEREFLRRASRSTCEYRDAPPSDQGLRECVWTEDWDGGSWETSCGEGFCFNDGGPEENKTRFCCYCGKPVLAVKYEYTDDEDEDDCPALASKKGGTP